MVSYVNELSALIPREDNEVLDYLEDILQPFTHIEDELRTEVECPHCGCYLFKSDLPRYEYVCAECDENF
jgi:DNA-directed RNA polymerase subunit RPC12/RpoP